MKPKWQPFFPEKEGNHIFGGSPSDFTEDEADEEDVLSFPFDEWLELSSRDRFCQWKWVTSEKLRNGVLVVDDDDDGGGGSSATARRR